jgi:hypothetical protein
MHKFLVSRLATTRVLPMFAAAVESEANRARYIEQSAKTVTGRAAQLPAFTRTNTENLPVSVAGGGSYSERR